MTTRTLPRSQFSAILLAPTLLIGGVACTGTIVDPVGAGGPGAYPDGPGAGDDGDTPVGPGAEPGFCDDRPIAPAEAPLRRLTAAEYRSTVAAIFPRVALPEVELLENALEGVFENDVRGQATSDLLVEQYRDAAAAIAAAVSGEDDWRPCDGTGDACLRRTAETLGARAYRRPLTAEEAATFGDFVVTQAAARGPREALGMLAEAVLQTPGFLYKPEVGDPELEAPEGLVALSGHELANRLAYLLTGGPPDGALLDAAASGALATDAGLEAEARRLLAAPAAREMVARFHREWLQLRRIREVELDGGLFPSWTGRVRQDLEAGTERFLDHAFWEVGTLESLYLGREAWVTDRTAEIYGVPAPGTNDLTRVTLPEDRRAGVLTQPGLLASTSHGLAHSPILRGVLILDAVLCSPSPPPPPDVLESFDEDAAAAEATTTREKLELTHGTRECSVCHEAIDGMGFSFENFDAVGRFVTEERGQPVDPTGLFRGEPVDGAVDLAERLAGDEDVAACMATQWYRFALGRKERHGDRCQIQALADELEATGGDLQELVVALVGSTAFRFRPVGE
jgi:hypothetical protein